MMEQKRRPCSAKQNTLSSLISKRHKGDMSILSKDRKEKLGEKIMALQQLFSPHGKTDTASILSEATEYIQFLQEQVKVLSAPYLQSDHAAQMQGSYTLRSRGLCLVPISCTLGVARTNGADIWAPTKSTSPKLKMPISHLH